ncbi:PRC-barrel domain-containing protein [Hymenobacter sp. GOD-10R]|uniref:PRC-barrel domain-containing protein n=1 Tax=Hymenobacter sp. GOD-10R TaxID=3093922 RepID=UPI002D7661BD|nr:PRC-barrel domain-containing protein [Hymenobacter sp. GOD-10R]WRQ27832.1 PRC-barrel domain-containing protein [Hymenobacter sp. GOD-10R]
MEANANVPSGQGMHLRRLRDLPDFEVASNNPDVRGWSVRGSDGKKFGEVYELIVEQEALKVRYLDVELDSSLNINERDRHILLPIGVAALDEESDNVFVPSLTSESVLNYPPFVEIQITREYEQAMLKSLNLPLPSHADAEFYNHTSYDEQQFYRRGRSAE